MSIKPEVKGTSQATEDRIFRAAREVFFQQGYDGARMEEIARRADANKAMLHYYFRSKHKLFLAVFRSTVEQIVPHITQLLGADLPVLEKVERFVGSYLEIAIANPHLPGFMFEEMRRNPDWFVHLVKQHTSGLLEKLSGQIDVAVGRGVMRPIAAEQLLTNLLALCAFPFLARPSLQALTGLDDAQYQTFLDARRAEVTTFVKRALAP